MDWTGVFINLDRHPERRSQAEAELSRLPSGGSYQRFAAIDGSAEPGRAEISARGELGCYLSHLEVIKRSVGQDEWLHVVEDDVVVSRWADAAITLLLSLPDAQNWDLLFTNVLFPLDNWVVSRFRQAFDGCVALSPSGNVESVHGVEIIDLCEMDFLLTTSYLVNPRSIAKLADLLTEALEDSPFAPIDALLQKLVRGGKLTARCSVPFFTVPRLRGGSTIQHGVSAWRISHLIMETALFADRDIADLRRVLDAVSKPAVQSVTCELISTAYSYSISVDPDAPISSLGAEA